MTEEAPTTDVEVTESLEGCRDEWGALARETRNVFSTWEWAATWWRHHGSRTSPLVVTCREQGRVTAILPLYLWTQRPLRTARFIGHGPADQLGPICGLAGRGAAAAGLRHALDRADIDVVFAELLPGGFGWSQHLGSRPLLVEPSPVVSLGGGWERFLESRSANLRQQIRRRERQLRSRHAVRLRLADDPGRLQDDLTTLFALHRSRWGGGSPFLRFEPFHRDFAAVALEHRWLRLWLLELDDRPAAAWYGLRFAGVESYYQAGRDQAFADASIGFVLLAHSIREAADDGMDEYRLLRGGERFKARFADSDAGVETHVLTRGVRGAVARLAASAAVRSDAARSGLRRLARG
jgi:CelD/BcsL family acetyltransferase involved in cellulose biosynthesis